MSSAVQRNSLRLNSPRVAPIGGQQFGIERGMIQDTSGDISPIGGPLAPVAPMNDGGGLTGLGGGPFGGGMMGEDGNGPISLGLPLTRLELGSLMSRRMQRYE